MRIDLGELVGRVLEQIALLVAGGQVAPLGVKQDGVCV